VELPDTERESRPDTERRDLDDCDDVRELRALRALEPEAPLPPVPRELLPPPATPVGGEATIPVADTTGARPQVSQYSSPPPTSSYVPPQSGR
jgi:hypothetical protein